MSVKRSFDTHLISGLLRSYAASAIRFIFYKVTPCLKIAISWKPASSDFDFFPDAISRTKSRRFSESSSRGVSFTMTPQLKSIQFCFFFASWLFVEIFTVGTGLANGVPRPVVKSTMCAPDAARAVEATRSLPGALSRFNPFSFTGSP